MNERYLQTMRWSAIGHGIALALFLAATYLAPRTTKHSELIFELVAGAGDNYMAREAPALGNSAPQLKVPDVPEPPVVVPVPRPAPATPVVPTPPKETPKETPKTAPKESPKETPKLMSKAEFDRLNAGKSQPAPPKAVAPKVQKIDAEGIAGGVRGGSNANRIGGAGGRALVADPSSAIAAYEALLIQRLKANLNPPSDLSNSLEATASVRISAAGVLSGGRITTSSGSPEFDRAVLDAIAHTTMPERPPGFGSELTIPFRMRDVNRE